MATVTWGRENPSLPMRKILRKRPMHKSVVIAIVIGCYINTSNTAYLVFFRKNKHSTHTEYWKNKSLADCVSYRLHIFCVDRITIPRHIITCHLRHKWICFPKIHQINKQAKNEKIAWKLKMFTFTIKNSSQKGTSSLVLAWKFWMMKIFSNQYNIHVPSWQSLVLTSYHSNEGYVDILLVK